MVVKPNIEELESKLAFYEDIINNLPVLVYINAIDRLNIEWANDYFTTLHGFEPDEMEQIGYEDFINEYYKVQGSGLSAKSIPHFNTSNQSLTFSYKVKHKNGAWKWFYARALTLSRKPNGDADRILVVGFDFDTSIDKTFRDMFLNDSQLENKNLIDKLTKREKEIIKMMTTGLLCPEIAKELGISPHTADTHRKNIQRKLQVGRAAGIVAFAIKNGLD